MSDSFQPLICDSLNNYKIYTSTWEYQERICGYDQQGNSWWGEELLALRAQGLIIKECPEKTVFIVGEKGCLLGYVREFFDNTWLASTCYFPCIVEISGFKNEFYAVRYLHQVMEAAFPNIEYEPVPALPYHNEKLSELPDKPILDEYLNALLGYIQECYPGIWCAYSCYYPKSMNAIKAVGFISEFYAVRYLYQITEIVFPNILQDIPNLPWE